MNLLKVKKITHYGRKQTYDITVANNHNFFCNNYLIHNCDYRGHVIVLLYNLNASKVEIKAGERIAQLVIQRVLDVGFEQAEAIETETERGENGFGSTDK